MNGWDVFTWLCSVALAVSAIVIFVFFLKDARSIISGIGRESDDLED
ncbi:MAG: hypothetical protein JRE70_08125 [Deltaproteobacteria bacterium]|nr:hypothetical protein [Deltaproteobacteria bacterium]